jgi:putative endonuclease
MHDSTRDIGAIGEILAAKYLQHKGYQILKRNWYCNHGELDIIAKEKAKLVFVEVKYVRSPTFCAATDLYTSRKQMTLKRTIGFFLKKYLVVGDNWRFDLLCITQDGSRVWFEHFTDALVN